MAIRQVHVEQEELVRSEGFGAMVSFNRSFASLAVDLELSPRVTAPPEALM